MDIRYFFLVMATRQNSLNGKPKSPRIQVVLPEELCSRLSELAEIESRTVSNMAKVLIQEGVIRKENNIQTSGLTKENLINTEVFRSSLESQQSKRLKGAPRRLRIFRP